MIDALVDAQCKEAGWALPECTDVILFGEGYGAKIQKGGGNYLPDGVGFILFDVMVSGAFLERPNVEDIAAKLGIPVVPIIGHGVLSEAEALCKVGFDSVIAEGRCKAEGLVLRPIVELLTRRGQRIITKIKLRDFL